MEKQKKLATKDTQSRKQKAIDEEVHSQKRRKQELQSDADSLCTSASQLA